MLIEAFQRLLAALDSSELDRPVAFSRGLEDQSEGQAGAAALVLEGDGRAKGQAFALAIGAVVIDQALRLHDFDELDPIPVVGAVRAVHRESPDPPCANIHLVDGRCEPARTKPPDDLLRVSPRLP